jgi:hypothetical protein
MVISSGYVDGYALHKSGAEGARKQITWAWSSASATARPGALDLSLLGFVLDWMAPGIRD